MENVWTPYAAQIDKNNPLPDYPRPQLQRNSFFNLNGIWKYAIGSDDEQPQQWDGEIVVPFCLESPLSGVEKVLLPGETLWYGRLFQWTTDASKKRVLLHFGAVDQECVIWLNEQKVGSHAGGYLPFTLDITDFLVTGSNFLKLAVKDDTDASTAPRGRQKLIPDEMWHSPTSGIWQTVWMECVPNNYVQKIDITPYYDEQCVEIKLKMPDINVKATVAIYAKNVLINETHFWANQPIKIKIPNMQSWSPESPFLYTFNITTEEDFVTSYFGMRKFGMAKSKDGKVRITLNNRIYFNVGVLDQGYYSDGLITPPSDLAMIHDIQYAKNSGFNMLRKHGKIDLLRWYYHCDRLGMLVWQDIPSGGEEYSVWKTGRLPAIGFSLDDTNWGFFGRKDATGRESFLQLLAGSIDLLHNVVSLQTWVPFNKGWGQFDSVQIAHQIHERDPLRLVDHASGWCDQGGGNILSIHGNNKPIKIPVGEENRALAITSIGTIGLYVKDHFSGDSPYAFKFADNEEEFLENLTNIYEEVLKPLCTDGLTTVVYYQLSDVENEVSGLITEDRMVHKVSMQQMQALNYKLLQFAYNQIIKWD